MTSVYAPGLVGQLSSAFLTSSGLRETVGGTRTGPLFRVMPDECAPVTSSSVAGDGNAWDVIERVGWASSPVTRDISGRSSACPFEEGRFRWGRRSWRG